MLEHPTEWATSWISLHIGDTCAAAVAAQKPQSPGGLHGMLARLAAERADEERDVRTAGASGETPICSMVSDGESFTGAAAKYALQTLGSHGRGAACTTASGEHGVVLFIDAGR